VSFNLNGKITIFYRFFASLFDYLNQNNIHVKNVVIVYKKAR